jgi:hypothetical protein
MRSRGRGRGRVQREIVRIKSRSVAIRTEPSRVAEVICSQEEGHIALVVEKKTVEGVLWFRFGCGWMSSKDSNGFDCYEMTSDVVAQKFWATEFDNRRRLSAAVANILTRTHSLNNARRTARQIRENAEIYRDRKKPLLNLPNVSMENMMVALQASARLKGPEIFEFIRIAAAHQSDPHKAIVEIAKDAEDLVLKRPSEWVKGNLGVINTVDSRSKNDIFIMAAARDDVNAFEKCLADGQELAALHSDLKYTALHAAADFGAKRVVRMLIKTGINLNLRDARHGMTALHFAAQSGRTEICEMLIEYGADRTMPNYEGLLPYEIADYQGHFECREKLKHVPPEVAEITLVASTSTSLEITWPHPQIHPKLQARIEDYGVIHDPTDSKRCGYGKVYVEKNNSFRIENLPPATGHSFSIYCRSLSGMSPPTAKVIHFTQADVPEQPQPMEILKIAKNGLYLAWHAPAYDNGSKVTLYEIEMRSAIPGEDLHDDGTLKSLSEMGIIPKSEYEDSDDEQEPPVELEPSSSIDAFGTESTVTMSTNAKRRQMDEEAAEDAERRYRLMKHRKVHRRHRFIIGLEQDRPYRFRVRALNEIGWSKWSEFTESHVPTDGVKVTEFGDDYAALEWFVPVLSHGRKVTGYELQMTIPKGPLETNISVYKNKDAVKIKMGEDETTTTSSYDFLTLDNTISEPCFTVNNLKPGIRYQFRVRCQINSVFTEWDLGFISEIVTMPAAPPDIATNLHIATVMGGMGLGADGGPVERLDVDHDSVTLIWDAGNPNGAPVKDVEVITAKIREYRPEDLDSAAEASSPTKGSGPGRLTASLTDQMSSLGMSQERLPGMSSPIDTGNPNITSMLEMSSSLGHTASGATDMTELTWLTVPGGELLSPQSYRVKHLTSGASYIFKVRTRNDCGWSEFSIASEMVTCMLVGPPLPPIAHVISTFYMVLRWNPAPNNQFNFTAVEQEFESAILSSPSDKENELHNIFSNLQWQACHFSAWTPERGAPTTGGATQEEGGAGGYVLIDKLQPNAPYLIRMRIRTVVGWSSWSLASDILQTPSTS